jgi:hypothetical protein
MIVLCHEDSVVRNYKLTFPLKISHQFNPVCTSSYMEEFSLYSLWVLTIYREISHV